MKIQFTRKNIGAIGLGFLVMLLIGVLTTAISVVVARFLSGNTTVIVTIAYLLGILTLFTPTIAGFIVGWRIRTQGWLYGGLLGVAVSLISMILASVTFILPASYISSPNFSVAEAHALARSNLLLQLTHTPLLVLATTLGGFLGEWAYEKRQKRLAVN